MLLFLSCHSGWLWPWDHILLQAPVASHTVRSRLHTLGSSGSFLSSVSLSPYICVSVDCMPLHSDLSCRLLIILCGLCGQDGQEVVWLGQHLPMPRPAQSYPGSTHFTYIPVCIRYSVLLLFLLFLFFFCCCYFLTANACRFILGEGSVPGRSSWGLFTQLKGSFFLQHGTFNPNPHSNQVSRDRGCCCTVQTVKPIEEIWLWFWAI